MHSRRGIGSGKFGKRESSGSVFPSNSFIDLNDADVYGYAAEDSIGFRHSKRSVSSARKKTSTRKKIAQAIMGSSVSSSKKRPVSASKNFANFNLPQLDGMSPQEALKFTRKVVKDIIKKGNFDLESDVKESAKNSNMPLFGGYRVRNSDRFASKNGLSLNSYLNFINQPVPNVKLQNKNIVKEWVGDVLGFKVADGTDSGMGYDSDFNDHQYRNLILREGRIQLQGVLQSLKGLSNLLQSNNSIYSLTKAEQSRGSGSSDSFGARFAKRMGKQNVSIIRGGVRKIENLYDKLSNVKDFNDSDIEFLKKEAPKMLSSIFSKEDWRKMEMLTDTGVLNNGLRKFESLAPTLLDDLAKIVILTENLSQAKYGKGDENRNRTHPTSKELEYISSTLRKVASEISNSHEAGSDGRAEGILGGKRYLREVAVPKSKTLSYDYEFGANFESDLLNNKNSHNLVYGNIDDASLRHVINDQISGVRESDKNVNLSHDGIRSFPVAKSSFAKKKILDIINGGKSGRGSLSVGSNVKQDDEIGFASKGGFDNSRRILRRGEGHLVLGGARSAKAMDALSMKRFSGNVVTGDRARSSRGSMGRF